MTKTKQGAKSNQKVKPKEDKQVTGALTPSFEDAMQVLPNPNASGQSNPLHKAY